MYPSSLVIEDVLFENFSGTSNKYDPVVGSLVCSGPSVCKIIQAKNISITNPSGKAAKWTFTNMNKSLLAIASSDFVAKHLEYISSDSPSNSKERNAVNGDVEAKTMDLPH
ncbi:hypothetical protein HYALB_00005022 [Hymenoscyphus albidus]|uniref:Uncharacterized protein n=1 Tax=Hymenoscyphus albidus TaxID=595503 RepID=A0A9N9LHC3_9HELO|nr:hypothetical protein HYALB_00005022 [Hymenoscyphus albidus]